MTFTATWPPNNVIGRLSIFDTTAEILQITDFSRRN